MNFSGIPDSRNDVGLQIFLTRAAKPRAGNTCWTWPGSTPKPPRPSPEPSPEPCWTWPGSAPKASQTFSGTFSQTLTWLCTKDSQTFTGTFSKTLFLVLHQSFPDLLQNLLGNPVELDLALHQSLPDFYRNLRNLLRNFFEPDPAPAPMHTGAILGWRPHYFTLLGKKMQINYLCAERVMFLKNNVSMC